MQLYFLLAAALAGLWYGAIQLVDAASCNQYDSESTCESDSACYWRSDLTCSCASNVTMDIVYALDSSGSIGAADFPTELSWVAAVIDSGTTASARTGIIRFSTNAEYLLRLPSSESMTTAELEAFVEDIDYNGGYTNTVEAIEYAISEFDTNSRDEISKVFIIVTDGNPYLPNNGDVDVCAWSSALKSRGITTVIIGVGSGWNPDIVDCLVSDPSHMIEVSAYTDAALDTILPALTDVICPVTYQLTVTEAQVDVESSTVGSRFIEFYNDGSDMTLKDITVSGLFSGVLSSDDTAMVAQGKYLVIYDGDVADPPQCYDCDCTKDSANWCTDATYIKCTTSGGSCWKTSNTMSNSDWYITFTDNTLGETVDSVTYDSSSWLSILTGYSYELKFKGYDNDLGSNWAGSCNSYGTPGADPVKNCSYACNNDKCNANGDTTTCDDTDLTQPCDCTTSDNYYFSGDTCILVPPPRNCYAYWLKNETNAQRYVLFVWEHAATDDAKNYSLKYYDNDPNTGMGTALTTARTKRVLDADYSLDPTTDVAGNVRTQIDGVSSESVDCVIVTSAPTSAPTMSPTRSPTIAPTPQPTSKPTPYPPRVWVGGDICLEDRCECSGSSWDCTGDVIDKKFAASTEAQFLTIKRWPSDYPYPVTVDWDIDNLGEYNSTDDEDEDEDDQGNQKKLKRVMKQWNLKPMGGDKFAVDYVNDKGNHQRKLAQLFTGNAFATTDGNVTVTGGVSPTSGTVRFNETGSYEEKIQIYIYETLDTSDEEYRLYHLVLRSCDVDDTYSTSVCYLTYPYELYMIVDITNSAFNMSTSEEEMPRWLWWVIGGLIIFLFLLAWLVYRYWWKNKQTSEELAETDAELQTQIAENELGFGRDLGVGDVAFNPMATGVPGSAKAPDLIAPEMDAQEQAAMNQRADVAVEKFEHREEFGAQAGARKAGAGNDLEQPLLG